MQSTVKSITQEPSNDKKVFSNLSNDGSNFLFIDCCGGDSFVLKMVRGVTSMQPARSRRFIGRRSCLQGSTDESHPAVLAILKNTQNTQIAPMKPTKILLLFGEKNRKCFVGFIRKDSC